MEQLLLPPTNGITKHEETPVKASPFIIANTQEVSLYDLEHQHIIPVYVKDNEPLISHYDFINAAWEVASHVYGNISDPQVRMSHQIKGRIPEARNKPAADLQDNERTLYYERMMFIIEIPCNYDEVSGNTLSLTVGGVKAYNLDNLYNKKGAPEHFKVFVGFKNSVCCNLCVSTDGLMADMRVSNHIDLHNQIYELLCRYNALEHLKQMQSLPQYCLTEKQFAQLIGRCRLYQHLSIQEKVDITPLHFGDQQLNSICKDYYKDKSFCRSEDGSINLWRLCNLFTAANKSSYIDSYLEKGVSAENLVLNIKDAMDGKASSWFLQ